MSRRGRKLLVLLGKRRGQHTRVDFVVLQQVTALNLVVVVLRSRGQVLDGEVVSFSQTGEIVMLSDSRVW